MANQLQIIYFVLVILTATTTADFILAELGRQRRGMGGKLAARNFAPFHHLLSA